MIQVIDVSRHQKEIDYHRVKAAGIRAVIIRCGYGDDIPSQDDEYWKINVERARAAGLRIGAYLYSYADSVAHAVSEAAHAIRLLQGISLDLPIFYDMEDENTTGKCSPVLLGDMAEIFCKALQDAGYPVGIYANKYWFTNKLTDPRFAKWDKWVAQYHDVCTYEGEKVGWQYTSTGSVDGVQGNVDISEFYKEYTGTGNPDVPQINVWYQVYTTEDRWLPVVKNLEDYAGWQNHSIRAVAIQVPGHVIRYRAHIRSGKWLPYVSGFDTNDFEHGYAGNLKSEIDAIEVIIEGATARYRVQANGKEDYFDWQHNNRTSGGQDGYAGVFGKAIVKFQMCVQ